MTEEQLDGYLRDTVARHHEPEYEDWLKQNIARFLSNYFSAKKTKSGASIANIIDQHL